MFGVVHALVVNGFNVDDALAYYGTLYIDESLTELPPANHYYSRYYVKLTSDMLNDKTICGLSYTDYTNTKNLMLESIYKNGGFWIGRYEAGFGDTEPRTYTRIGEDSALPLSKAEQYPYNQVSCSEAQLLASKISEGKKYNSSLMFGIQWDLVMKYLEEKSDLTYADIATDSANVSAGTNWGNYDTSTFALNRGMYALAKRWAVSAVWYSVNNPEGAWVSTNGVKQSNKMILYTTGACDGNSKQNIYDLAGNVSEYTLERAGDYSIYLAGSRVTRRGGDFWNSDWRSAAR